MNDWADEIKAKATIQDVVEMCGFQYKKRMPCPIHGGKDNNFWSDEKRYFCHSHCGGGDVIKFVMTFFECDFKTASIKINEYLGLGLPIGEKPSLFQHRKQQKAVLQRLETNRKKQIEFQKIQAKYQNAFDFWKRLDDAKRKYKPKTPSEELNPLFIESLQKLEYAEYCLNCAELERCNYERNTDTKL